MEKDQIIGKLSSYFKLSGLEAENIYKEIFDEVKVNGGKENRKSSVRKFASYSDVWKNDVYCEQEIPFPVQKDENQLELEYDSFTEHRSKINKEIEREEESKDPILIPVQEKTQQLQLENKLFPPQIHEESNITTGNTEITLADESKHPATDNSYYIWYKDAESDVAETETMSYEYELMYQAAKESEYQSKMKIYAASFVFFFSFVLLMLILSPIIYKKYFITEELQSLGETLSGGNNEQKAVPNNLKDTPLSIEKAAYSSLQAEEEEPEENTERSSALVKSQESGNKDAVSEKQPEPEVTQNEPADVRKTLNGWTDDKYNVLYIKLDNGKYTIQESSWDSREKAEKRKAEIESLGIAGLNAAIAETDLGNKGKWYRVRFGEFSTLNEARQKVEEFLKL